MRSRHGTGFYRCVILYGGVFDWEKLFNRKDSTTLFADRWLKQRLNDRKLPLVAPLQRSDEIKTPLFLTRNVSVRDITLQTQIFDLSSAFKIKVPCVNFGDLPNLYEQRTRTAK